MRFGGVASVGKSPSRCPSAGALLLVDPLPPFPSHLPTDQPLSAHRGRSNSFKTAMELQGRGDCMGNEVSRSILSLDFGRLKTTVSSPSPRCTILSRQQDIASSHVILAFPAPRFDPTRSEFALSLLGADPLATPRSIALPRRTHSQRCADRLRPRVRPWFAVTPRISDANLRLVRIRILLDPIPPVHYAASKPLPMHACRPGLTKTVRELD
jgi:hypothetical protein